jgi:NAD(P)-dependent dehydrogenase (short-subunit alcohol dehydrogenase family)
MQELAGRVAVITGAGSGLGAAMADALAAERMRIVALDIDGVAAEATVQRLQAAGAEAIAQAVDVASRPALADAAAATREAFGACDLLCANVGVQQFGAIERLTADDWQWMLSVNVIGLVQTVDAFLPLLRASNGERRIVVTSSSSYFVPSVRLGAYVTTKYAVVGYAEVLRLELEPEGIGVTLLFPAGMLTRHLDSSKAARPAELGESVIMPDDIDEMIASRKGAGDTVPVSPEFAIRNFVRDLRDGRDYVITHGDYRVDVEQRQREIFAAFDRMESSDDRRRSAQ